MKKILPLLSALFIFQIGTVSAQDFEFDQELGSWPLQLALYPRVQMVHHERDIAGVRLSVISANRKMTGLDVGFISQTDEAFNGLGLSIINLCQGNSAGVSVGFINHVNGDMMGFQGIPFLTWWNAFNVVHGHCEGAQWGLFNEANKLTGLQVGLGNIARDAGGIQVGFYNYTEQFNGLDVGLINIAYKKLEGVQIGLYNGVGDAKGLQVGLINQCQNLDGVQIGILNIASQKEVLPVTVLVNWQF